MNHMETIMTNEKKTDRALHRIFFTGGVLVLMLIVGIMQYWYIYVTNSENLYDSYGVKINSFLPVPLKNWGCEQLKIRFSSFPPPTGCKSQSGLEWR